MPTRSRLRRGFTLLEVMTAVVIIIILAALAVTYMVYGMGKVRMNNAVFDVTAMISAAQLRAVSNGIPNYVFVYQTPDGRVRIEALERPDVDPTITNWDTLNLTQGPDVALAFTRPLEDGTTQTRNAPIRDQIVLGVGGGQASSGVAFLDLDSDRIHRPLPAPFSAISLTTSEPTNPLDKPTQSLLAGCNFCVDAGGPSYGVLRFNPDGTMRVLTNRANAASGAVIAFAPNTEDEKGFAPKLLTVSAPAGAAVVF